MKQLVRKYGHKADRWIGIVAVTLLGALPALAGTVSLDISVTVNKRELDVELEILVANRGDDTASRVQPSARVGDVSFTFEPATVGPNKRRIFRARNKIPAIASMKPGQYPVPVSVVYQDTGGARFYAPAYGLLHTAESADAPAITVQADAVNLRGSTRLSMRLQPSGTQKDQSVTVTPHTTSAVSISPASTIVQVSAGKSATVEFAVRNLSGLAGSRMPLLLFLETDSDHSHGTLVHEVPLTIEEGSATSTPNVTANCNLHLIIGLVIGVLLLAGVGTAYVMIRNSRETAKSINKRHNSE